MHDDVVSISRICWCRWGSIWWQGPHNRARCGYVNGIATALVGYPVDVPSATVLLEEVEGKGAGKPHPIAL